MADEVVEEQVVNPPVVGNSEESVVRSGANRSLAHELNKPSASNPESMQPQVPPPVYDYSFIKDLSEDDLKKYQPLKEKYGEDVYHQTVTLANDVKKHQRIVSEREKKIQAFESAKPDEELTKHREFIEGLRKDAIGTYKRFQKDFNLPEPEFLEKQVASGGDVQSRLAQFQDGQLVPDIEKKFKIETGTFVYDPSEAYKAGTPSYEFRVSTERKETEFNNEYNKKVQLENEVLTTAKSQLEGDMKYLRDTFFPDSEFVKYDEKGNVINAEEAHKSADEAFTKSLAKIDENQNAIKEGKFDSEQNPYSLRVIFRGMHFEELAKARTDKVINDIHKQYHSKGLYLPSEETPIDATKIKGNAIPQNLQRGKLNPARRELNRVSATNN
jgi:hypothetical protein